MKNIISIVFLLSSITCWSQNHDHIWLLGHGQLEEVPFSDTRIDFNDCPLTIEDDPRELAFFQSGITISDKEGSLLFYSNGKKVHNHLDELMENGDSLNAGDHWEMVGSSYVGKPQNIIGLPFSSNSSKYHLLHIGGRLFPDVSDYYGFALYYSMVNMDVNGGAGAVVEKNTPIIQDTLWSDKVTAVQHANGRDWWVVVNEYNTNNYYKVLVSPDGAELVGSQEIGTPVNNGLGQTVFSPNGEKFAFYNTVSNVEGQALHIYDFDRCTGEMSNEIYIHTLDTVGAGGIAISPNSRFVYVPALTKLWQYDLWANDVPASVELVGEYDGFQAPFSTAFFAAQLAPNGKIYVGVPNGVTVMHTIEKPNKKGLDCDFRQHNVDLINNNGATMPNYPNYRLGPVDGSPCDTLGLDNFPVAKFTYESDSNDILKVQFTDLSFYEPQEWWWEFGDGFTSQDAHPQHLFQNMDNHEVCLTVTNPMGEHTYCKTLPLIVLDENEKTFSENKINLFPNPVSNYLNIKSEVPIFRKNASISIFNSLGNKIMEIPYSEKIDLSTFSSGLYFLKIENKGGEIWSEKVIVK